MTERLDQVVGEVRRQREDTDKLDHLLVRSVRTLERVRMATNNDRRGIPSRDVPSSFRHVFSDSSSFTTAPQQNASPIPIPIEDRLIPIEESIGPSLPHSTQAYRGVRRSSGS